MRLDRSSDAIEVVPYDSKWPARFEALGRKLRSSLGDAAVRIDHIGSTAVPNLSAKPIIDVQISVTSLEPIGAYRSKIEDAGFIWRSDNPDKTKRYFREKPGDARTHIHVRQAGSWSEQFALLFRDFLRHHPEDASEYAQVKVRLAQEFRGNRRAYTDAKEPIIWSIMQKASAWSQRTGWMPGKSDA